MNLRQEKLKNGVGGGTAYAAIPIIGGWDDALAANKEKGFYNHSENAVTKTSPV